MEEVLNYLKKKKNKGANLEELKNIFGEDVHISLNILQDKGKVAEIKRNNFISLAKTHFLVGRAIVKGKNLYIETEREEFFFSINKLRIMDGDLVLLKRERKGVRTLKILRRFHKKLIGFYLGEKEFVPINKVKEEFSLIKPLPYPIGSIIETEIILYPDIKRNGILALKSYIGKYLDTSSESKAFCVSKNLPFDFPEEVLNENFKIKKDYKNRIDLRKEEIFTIDPEDSKDFDDAISLRKENENLILGVHIADVTHYLKEGTLTDREAQKRAETIYFPTIAVHMLPQPLSENLCSLKEKKDRLTISVFMHFTKKGKLLKTEIFKSVINSKKRFTYEEVEDILKGAKSPFKNTLRKMEEFFEVLKEKRMKRGSLEFEFLELKSIYDENKNFKGVEPLQRLKSHSIVEEFMLCANKEVARFLFNKNLPFLYRIHSKPDPFKLEDLKKLCQRMGLSFPVNPQDPTPKMLQKVLEEWKKSKDGLYFQELLLRSLPRAIYSPKRELHFALNFPLYCHFTSPIRRYADVIVHRALKCALSNKKYERKDLPSLAEHLNKISKEKEELERDFLEYKILQTLKGKEREVLKGTIVSIIDSGFFVFLDDYFISGFLPFSSFSETYLIPYKGEQRVKDPRGKYNFKIRDEIKVKISKVDPFKRQLSLQFYKA